MLNSVKNLEKLGCFFIIFLLFLEFEEFPLSSELPDSQLSRAESRLSVESFERSVLLFLNGLAVSNSVIRALRRQLTCYKDSVFRFYLSVFDHRPIHPLQRSVD